MEIAPDTRIVTTDTIDASDLFVHSASAIDQNAPKVGSVALLVLRTGPSQGDPAVGLIGGSPAWHFGRENELVATDARGAVPGSETDMLGWTPESPETLRIVFSTGYIATSFRLRSDGTNLVGTVTRSTDNAAGPAVTAPVVLRRIECPARGQ